MSPSGIVNIYLAVGTVLRRNHDANIVRVYDLELICILKGTPTVCQILRETSRRLESLDKLTNTQSFFLTIDPNDPTDQGFLGGTILGREFWRGLRGGGDTGAKNFRTFCLKHTGQNTLQAVPGRTSVSGQNVANVPLPSHTKRGPASELKAQVYSAVRDTLRYVYIPEFQKHTKFLYL